MPLSLLNHSALALFAQRTRIPTSARSIGFCAIWVCISSSSSQGHSDFPLCTWHLAPVHLSCHLYLHAARCAKQINKKVVTNRQHTYQGLSGCGLGCSMLRCSRLLGCEQCLKFLLFKHGTHGFGLAGYLVSGYRDKPNRQNFPYSSLSR